MRKHLLLILFLAASVFAPAPAAFAASPTLVNRGGRPIMPDGNSPFGGPYDFNWQAVPTSLTDVATVTSHITGYCFYNSTGGSVTMTVQTKDMSPLPLPLSGPLAAGTSACFVFSLGLRTNGGFSVQASGAGVYYSAVFTN